MEPTTHNNPLRSLLLFIIIGVVLLAAVILGVRWARGRSDQLATQNTQQSTPAKPEEQKAEEQKPTTPAQQPVSQPIAAAQSPTVAPPSTAVTTPTHVPATGIEEALLPILVLAGTAFAGSMYMQSRRRLVLLK